MRKSLMLFALFMGILLSFSVSTLAQQASVGHSAKSSFLNPMSECTGQGELIYDDGSFENGYGWNTTVTDGQIVMLFTPISYPYPFSTFCISLTANGASNTLTFDVVVYDNTGAGGAPGNLVATVTGLTATGIPTWPTLAWYDFDISSIPELTSGSYYIGMKWNPTTYQNFYIGADESSTTPIQPGYASADGGVTWGTNASFWAGYRAMGIRTLGGIPCSVESASNPNPADGATDVDANIAALTWDNGAGAVTNEVYFGTDPGNLPLVQSGSLASSYSLSGLDYNTVYYWKINEIGDTCSTMGPTWSFTTMQDPNLITLFMDDFENGTGNYTITTSSGCPWDVFTDPAITGRYTMPATAGGGIFAADADHCGTGGSCVSTAVLNNPIDATQYNSVAVEWDNDWQAYSSADFAYLDVSTDGGSTWNNVVTFDENDVRNTHEYYNISSLVGLQSFMLRLVSDQPGWDWWWAVDNLQVTGWDIVPVELSSFTASISSGNVVLNWSTATETNNKGFEIQRSNGSKYQTIGFVQGNGTSTQQHTYTYSDQNVANGNYSYRLKQVDFDGSSEFSQVVEVTVNRPVEYNLAQNYPNPFNPSTKINYGLKVDSKVTLKVFDILGQEVATLLNENIAAGNHSVTFDASKLNSGVYLYKIEARGVDGSSFTSVKKMILTK